MSSAKLTTAMAVEFADVLSDNLAADGAVAAWNSGTTYAAASYVYVLSTRKRYLSQQGSNLNHNPVGDDGTWWVEDSWVNSWRALAQDVASATVADDTSGIEFEIEADGTYTHIGLLGVRAASVTVVVKNASAVEVHNETQTGTTAYGGASFYRPNFIFDDLPIESGFTVEITIADTGVTDVLAQVAKVVIGKTYSLGELVAGDTSSGFEDFSIKEQDEFGDWDVTPRGYSDLVTMEVFHQTNRTRWLKNLLVSKRLTPCLYWVETDATHHLGLEMIDTGIFIFGYADTPETEPQSGWSSTTFDIVGLSFDPSGAAAFTALDPGPPQEFGASDWSLAAGSSSSLAVTIVTVDETATDIDYRLKESASPTWGTAVSTGGVTSFNITGLDAETEYDVQIRPVNAAGDGDWSGIKTATTDAAPSEVFATLLHEQNFATTTLPTTGGTEFAVDADYSEIWFLMSGAVNSIHVEISTDGGSTWINTGYETGYIRTAAQFGMGQAAPALRVLTAAGAGMSSAFGLDGPGKPHAVQRDGSTDYFVEITKYDSTSVTHWRLIADGADVTTGYMKVLGVNLV